MNVEAVGLRRKPYHCIYIKRNYDLLHKYVLNNVKNLTILNLNLKI